MLCPQGELQVTTPRDRFGQFSPELVAKRQRTLSSGLDEQIMALYAQGNSIEDVRRLLEQADAALAVFGQQWSKTYGYLTQQWRQHWEELTAYFSFTTPLRRMIYPTNPVEPLRRIIHKLVKSKAAWGADTALIKQLVMSLMHNEKFGRRRRRAYHWKVIQRELLDKYPERVKLALS